jgi:uncharacterized protein involved in exopolysaccharide biosynthesis
VNKNLELGILSVSVKNDRERDAVRILEAIQEVLTTKNQLFRSGDEKSVEMRVLTGPLTERNPSANELGAAGVAGFFAGALLALFFIGMKNGRVRYAEPFENTETVSIDPSLRLR